MNKILFSLLLFTSFVLAKDTTLSHLITQIKQAPQSQKRALINQLKLKLRDTNIHQRHEIFAKLRDGENKNHKLKSKRKYKNRAHNSSLGHKQLRLHKAQNNPQNTSQNTNSPKQQHQKGAKH